MWFQNRRAKWRKAEKASGSSSDKGSDSAQPTASSPGSTTASSPQSCASETTSSTPIEKVPPTMAATPPPALPPPPQAPPGAAQLPPQTPTSPTIKPEQVERWANSPPGGFPQSGFQSPTSPHGSVVSPPSAGLPPFNSPLHAQNSHPYSSPTVPLNVMGYSSTYPPPLSRFTQC